jgi:DNA replication and repair protein RecF
VDATLLPDPGLPEVAIRTFTEARAPERRLLRINGAPAPLARLADWASLLWLTPAMDRLFADPASARRRFLDRLVLALAPDHAAHVSRYEAAMRARNRLLAADAAPDPAWLAALEAQMETHGAALASARVATVAALAGALAASPTDVFPQPTLTLAGNEAEDLAPRLAETRALDRAAGRTLAGPHRADLLVAHAGTGLPAATASTGEQKALLVSILLAHAALVAERTGRTPLLLLDEAVAHLDPERRQTLFRRLAALGGQSWLTGTEPALFEGLDAARHIVRDGTVEPA